uniref:Uncharacterized protein n=1 Tax=Anguilla anguilla TaxID=7936 RepID=A0A0E9T0R2_ANGAN
MLAYVLFLFVFGTCLQKINLLMKSKSLLRHC